MANFKNLPVCKYGEKCYRKNPQHFTEYYHAGKKTDSSESESSQKNELKRQKSDDVEESTSKKKARIENFFKRDDKGATQSDEKDNRRPDSSASDDANNSEDAELVRAAEVMEKSLKEEENSSTSADKTSAECSEACDVTEPSNIKESIKSKFLVDMPDDFYEFWEFCSGINPKNPCGALESVLGYTLVGPYDILAGRHRSVKGRRPNYLLHYRYYYDPPEMLTVVKGENKTQFHLGYFRDDPKEMPVFVASNSAAVDCIIKPRGGNLFSAICNCIDDRIKEGSANKSSLTSLRTKLCDWAKLKQISLEVRTPEMKERDKKVVTKSFHGAGVVVPVDENEVGYRPLPETPANLKKILKKIVDSKSETERDKNFDELMEIMTLVQFANDECDYGEGLELGLDLFSYGSELFHKPILGLLPLAYRLLHRPQYADIIEAHIASRTHSSSDQLS